MLHEVTELDIKDLMALRPMMAALKEPAYSVAVRKRGAAAAHCRQVLGNMGGNLSETIREERL
ncbi:MAG: hypothetical protein BECKG1743D_GA0114223_105091 [Candidatus Kentron sp. G]|nr:MAG: hypothetical protein BECKG1743F_GA0114225_104705 [Candidatus Kentron sp. G]VFN02239.1 MAG: hypothetical protein BECKG1743E_GA0114224_104855 [Candidatus Kentron sp. G]VFN03738.1 MAG: hypothetical protein BECKG1743D_GA0114223_105091 [Candidatus Kentron sp. G]